MKGPQRQEEKGKQKAVISLILKRGVNVPLSDGGSKSKVPKTSKILTESF